MLKMLELASSDDGTGSRGLEAQSGEDIARELLELEKTYALAMLASETAHDLATPINLFDQLVQRLQRGERLAERDLTVAAGQIERCRSLVTGLRQVEMPRLTVEPLRVRPLLEHAVLASGSGVTVRIDVPPTLSVMADAPSLRLLLAVLVRTPKSTRTDAPVLHVWTSKTGLALQMTFAGAAEPRDSGHLEPPWSPSSSTATPQGALADVIARRLGYEVTHDALPFPGRTLLSIPAREVICD